MFVWLFLAWCVVAILRDLGALGPITASSPPAVLYARMTIVLLLVIALVFFRRSLGFV